MLTHFTDIFIDAHHPSELSKGMISNQGYRLSKNANKRQQIKTGMPSNETAMSLFIPTQIQLYSTNKTHMITWSLKPTSGLESYSGSLYENDIAPVICGTSITQ